MTCSEFFGTARWTHPIPASIQVLQTHFDYISSTHEPAIFPSANGESLPTLHNRYAYALDQMITNLDREVVEVTNENGEKTEKKSPKAILICTHAAGMICIGRALTGKMPDDVDEPDFKCGTCALTTFVRRSKTLEVAKEEGTMWDAVSPDVVPSVDWVGKGVQGGWDCVVNGDCSFLINGEERTW